MKLSTNKNTLATNIDKAADFGINDNDLSHIMGILRSQIYSDKLLAVIREYSTNAMDANVEANNPEPIEITLPSAFEPTLSFRDFGLGMSDDDVINTYIKYGNSTKRSSNDYTGCLGIGSKAGFAYGDTFTIISYTTDMVTTWLARIDESKRGTISIVNKEPNDFGFKTGTEIQVPIRKADIDQCVEKAQKFFRYWKLQPKGIQSKNYQLPDYLEQTDDYSILNKNYTYHHTAKVLMGNILYPIDNNHLSGTAKTVLTNNTIILNAPLGSLDIAANRETLEYSQRTIDSLTAMANNTLCDLANSLSKSVANCKTRIQASLEALKYQNVFHHDLLIKIQQQTTWNGLPIIRHIETNNANVVCHKLEHNWRSGSKVLRNKRDNKIHSFSLSRHVKICVHDESKFTETNATRRVRTLQSKDNSTDSLYYVIPKSKLNEITPKLTSDDYIDLTTIDPLPAKRTIIANPDGTSKKTVRINVCHVVPNTLKSERLTAEAEPVKCKTTDKYVYVPLDRFDWQGHANALDHLGTIQDAIKQINSDYVPTINGVKKHYVSKLNDEWITLDQYYTSLYNVWVANDPQHAKFINDINSTSNWNEWDHSTSTILSQTSADPNVAYLGKVQLARSGKTYSSLEKVITTAKLLRVIGSNEFRKTEHAILHKKYPLLNCFNPSYRDDATILIKHINQYIQSVS